MLPHVQVCDNAQYSKGSGSVEGAIRLIVGRAVAAGAPMENEGRRQLTGRSEPGIHDQRTGCEPFRRRALMSPNPHQSHCGTIEPNGRPLIAPAPRPLPSTAFPPVISNLATSRLAGTQTTSEAEVARIRIIATYESATTFYRDLPPYLVKCGHEVSILMSSTEYRGGRKSLADALEHTGVELDLIPGPRTVVGRWSKLVAMLRFFVGAVHRTLLGRPVDLNVFFSTPPLFAAWGVVLQKVRGQRFAALVMDVWPDVLAPGGERMAPVHRLLLRTSRGTWRRADAVYVIGRCMRDLVVSNGVHRERVHLVGNWAPTDTLDHDGTTLPIRRELGIDRDDLLVMYAGNMGLAHTFDEVLEVAQRLEHDDVGIHWLFVGDGQRRAEVEAEVRRRQLQRVSFLNFQPADLFADALATGDVHLVTMRPGYQGLVVPSKAFGPWAVGRPVLYVGDPSGEIARIIVEERVGAVVDNGDVDGLESEIRRLAANPGEREQAGHRARVMSHGAGRASPASMMSAYRRAIEATLR